MPDVIVTDRLTKYYDGHCAVDSLDLRVARHRGAGGDELVADDADMLRGVDGQVQHADLFAGDAGIDD